MEHLLSVPNQLTALRVGIALALPWVAAQDRWLWVAVWSCAKATDILDGYLARRWSLESDFGRQFDSLADGLLWAVSAGLICWHEPRVWTAHWLAWSAGLTAGIVAHSVFFARFRRPAALHLYSSRVAGMVGFFSLATVVVLGYYPQAVPLFVSFWVLNKLEVTAVGLLVEDPHQELKHSIFRYPVDRRILR